jgi:hypothetical protein
MSTLAHLILFIVILFLYLHISKQFQKSEDLEIYEMDYSNNSHLQEVCDIKQPILFEYKTVNPDFFEEIEMESLIEKAGSHDMKVKDNEDYFKENADSVDYIVLPLKTTHSLTVTDTHGKYFSENNESFVDDSGLTSSYKSNDVFLKPPFTVQSKYDLMIGSTNSTTPLRYHTCFRHYISVNSGKIRVKMTPWKSNKYLYPVKDYDNYEFFSHVNVWKTQKKYLHEMDKMKFLEFDVTPGYVLYIPPYWWYSIKYSSEPDTIVSGFTYNSLINCVANLPKWTMYYIQQTNTKKKIAKTMELPLIEKKEETKEITDKNEST